MRRSSINIGLGEAVQNAKAIDAAVNDLTLIAGQKPVVTRAKKSIAAFKLRAGMPIGAMVTLRGAADVRVPRPAGRPCRCRASATSGAFRRTRSTAAAITPSVFGSNLMFPEIDYDKIDKYARARGQLRDHRAKLMKKGGGFWLASGHAVRPHRAAERCLT